MGPKRIITILICLTLSSCSSTRTPLIPPPEQLPPARKIKDIGVALVLGGGGAKGIAHLGVIETLEKHGIPIDLIVGTSAGSVVGAMYADYRDSKLLKHKLMGLKKWDLLDFSLMDTLYFFQDLRAPIQGFYLEDYMVKNLSVNNMDELKIPFVAVTSDLDNEKSIAISSGPIATAVHASSAIPPFFRPVKAYQKLFVDGGVLEPVPVLTALEYRPKMTIAVDISSPGREYDGLNMWDITLRAMYISYYMLSQHQSGLADVQIHPDCTGFGMFDDNGNGELLDRGKTAAEAAVPKILAIMKEKGIPIKKRR